MNENKISSRLFGPKRDEVTGEWEEYMTRKLMTCKYIQYFSGDKIQKNMNRRTWNTYGGEERCVQSFGRES